MKFKISFIENIIEVNTEYVRCIEIENKNYLKHKTPVTLNTQELQELTLA